MKRKVVAFSLILMLALPNLAHAGRPQPTSKGKAVAELARRDSAATAKGKAAKLLRLRDSSSTPTLEASGTPKRLAKGKNKFKLEGIVQGVNGTSLSVLVKSGTRTIRVYRGQVFGIDASNARITRKGQPTGLGDAKVGDRAHISGRVAVNEVSPPVLTATRINLRPIRKPHPGSESSQSISRDTDSTRSVGPSTAADHRSRNSVEKAKRPGFVERLTNWVKSLF